MNVPKAYLQLSLMSKETILMLLFSWDCVDALAHLWLISSLGLHDLGSGRPLIGMFSGEVSHQSVNWDESS